MRLLGFGMPRPAGRLRLILGWWVVFRFDDDFRLGVPRLGVRRRLRRLLGLGYEVVLLQPPGRWELMPSAAVLNHLEVHGLPRLPVVRRFSLDRDPAIYVRNSGFWMRGGSWMRLWLELGGAVEKLEARRGLD